MAIAHLQSSPPAPGGEGCGAPDAGPVVARDRPERSLLELRRGGWISGEQVTSMQHAFVLEACAEAVVELGYGRTSANEIIRRARVSRRTFYDLFTGVDACFAAALIQAHDRVLTAARIGYAAETGGSWAERVRDGVVEVLSLFDAQPTLARLCVVQGPAGPPAALAAHRTLIAQLARAVGESAQGASSGEAPPHRVVRLLLGGAASVVHERLTSPDLQDVSLLGLTGEVMYALCGSLDGAASARRQLALPVYAAARDWSTPSPAEEPDGRWRAEVAGEGTRKQTLRFLVEHPGASNLVVGERFGVSQATASRRLASMARDRLIVSRKRAGRHAWHVTEKGERTLGPEHGRAPARRPVPRPPVACSG